MSLLPPSLSTAFPLGASGESRIEETSRATRRSLSVVIPAYNEERRLSDTVVQIHRYLVDRAFDAEMIVVDDGSRDKTHAVATELQRSIPLLRVISYAPNRGKGFAVRTGVLAATKESILFSDADLSTPIAELERLWPWYDRGNRIVIASRTVRQSELLVRQPLYRECMGKIFNGIISVMGVRGFRDTQCGFKLMNAALGRRIFTPLRTRGFAFDVELLLRARRLGVRVAEVGVQWRNSPDSRVHPVRDSARMLLEVLKMRGLS